MSVTRAVRPERERVMASAEIPPVPLTVEGYSVLHQMMRFRWAAWRGLAAAQRTRSSMRLAACLRRWRRMLRGSRGFFL